MHHNTESGKHGDREAGVNFTRAKSDAKLFTQDAEKAAKQMGVELQKTSAHDLAPSQPERSATLTPTPSRAKT